MNEDKRTGAHSATSVTQRGRSVTPAFHLYTPEEASRLLGADIVPASWLREKFRKREIPGVLIAGKIAFREVDLSAIVQQYEVTPGQGTRPAAAPRRRARETAASAPAVTPLRARPPQRLRRASGDGRA